MRVKPADPAGSIWRRIAGPIVAIATLVFLGIFVARNASELRAHEWSVRPWLLLASVGLNILGLSWGVAVWKRVLTRMDVVAPYRGLARVWFVSGLARYVPGKIWQFVGAAQLGPSIGIPSIVTVTSLAVHTGFFLLGAIVTSIYLIPTQMAGIAGAAVEVVRWLGPLVLLLAHPIVVGAGIRLVRRTTGGRVAQWSGTTWDGILLVLLSAIGWVISGVALFLFVQSLTPLPLAVLPNVIGINALAFVVGYAVFIAPAGLGAKEATLTALLSIYIPAPVAALVAIAARLWTVAAEVTPALLLLRLPRADRAARGLEPPTDRSTSP